MKFSIVHINPPKNQLSIYFISFLVLIHFLWRIWRKNCKYAFDENFHCHICSQRKAAKFCHPGKWYNESEAPLDFWHWRASAEVLGITIKSWECIVGRKSTGFLSFRYSQKTRINTIIFVWKAQTLLEKKKEGPKQSFWIDVTQINDISGIHISTRLTGDTKKNFLLYILC